MTFLYPMMLWALALPLLLALLALYRRHRRSKAWHLLVSPAHEEALVVKTPFIRSLLPQLLVLLALVFGILALARPINGYTTTEAMATGRNLLIALDISRSMETQDVKPSRLEEARAAAFELVDALPGDKIGLIVFSGEADLVVPLTYDHTALRDALEQVNRSWAGYGGTNFGLVLRKALQTFTRSAPTGTNALVIFSDGEDTVGTSLDEAKEARSKNLLVITVGVGTTVGDSIPDAHGENGLYQNAEGKHVISKLDTESLRQFAEATGGDYFTMGSSTDLSAFARQAAEKLDKHEESFAGHKVPNELFAPFALTALVLLALAILFATEWRTGRRVVPCATLLLLLLPLLSAAPLQAAPEADALSAYGEALTLMSRDAEKARELFSRALLDEDSALQAACLYELGNLNASTTFSKLRELYGQGQPEAGEGAVAPGEPQASPTPEQLQGIVDELHRALQSYRDALSIQPGLRHAKTNLTNIEAFIEKLKEEIERLKQQQQQQQQQNQQNSRGEDEQPRENEDDQQEPEDGKDDQKDQPRDQQDQQDQQKPGENEDSQPQQDEQPRQDEQQDSARKPEEPQPRQPEEKPMSEQEKARHRAASVLKMHLDEEHGSPIPHADQTIRPPEKDY